MEIGGALDLSLSFDIGGASSSLLPQSFGVAVRASRSSLAGAAVQLQFNVSAAASAATTHGANAGLGRWVVSVRDIAHPLHQPARPVQLSRWMNDTDLGGGDYNITHHLPSSGDTAATCQALCDGDEKCAAWVWVIRGVPAGTADCCLKTARHACPSRSPAPHPCRPPCAITSGVKEAGGCTNTILKPVEFGE